MKTEASSFDSAERRDSLHQHLHAYALAASAAGVTMLALAQPAPAEIVYTPANITIGPNQSYNLDLNNDGITDFTITNQFKSSASGFQSNLFVQNLGSGNAVAAHLDNSGGFPWAYAFYSGFRITQAQRHFTSGRATMVWGHPGKYRMNWRGSFAGSGFGWSGYLGLKFKIKGKIHYGWAFLGTDPFESHSALLTGYAYETTPNKAIKTGQEQGTDKDESGEQPRPAALAEPDQTPATLGALAKGAEGLRLWRQNQQGVRLQEKMSVGDGN
ncbi:MAG: hypothetical protein WBQ43_22350 [Terriglobales bacterium]